MEPQESRAKRANRQRIYRSVLRETERQMSNIGVDPVLDDLPLLDDLHREPEHCAPQEMECSESIPDETISRDDSRNGEQIDDLHNIEMIMEAEIAGNLNQNLDDFENERNLCEEEQLRMWAVKNNQTDASIDQLLKILRSRLMPELPKSAKTFLRTNIRHKVHKVVDDDQKTSEYVFYGLEENLRKVINPELHPNKKVEVSINVDGLSIYKSSNIQFWPILVKVHVDDDLYKPFVAGVWSGVGKPSMGSPLWRIFIQDLNNIRRTGLIIDGELYEVILKAIIADTPARAAMKCTKGHGGYCACERCVVEGLRVENSIVFLECDAEARTDESFRNQTDQEHHQGVSPFLVIDDLDMIMMFLLDYMHLACNGVTKKLLCDYWIYGTRKTKFTRSELKELNRRLDCIKNKCIPIEFQRKSRNCETIKKWKATELRFFLLYSGPIILRRLLRKNFYEHFNLLHVSFRILCSDDFKTKNEIAKMYLRKFVMAAPLLYGRRFMSINAHNLLHVADDTANMRCNLSKLSAFPFENCLKRLRDMVHTPNKPLAQLNRRLQQNPHPILETPKLPEKLIILKKRRFRNFYSINIIKLNNSFTITCRRPNNCVVDTLGRILFVKKMYSPTNDEKNIRISGIILKKVRCAYSYPEKSSKYGIYEVAKTNERAVISVDLLKGKMVLLSLNFATGKNYKHFAIPMLH